MKSITLDENEIKQVILENLKEKVATRYTYTIVDDLVKEVMDEPESRKKLRFRISRNLSKPVPSTSFQMNYYQIKLRDMTTTQQRKEPMVQMYDYSRVKEYYKIFKGFLYSSTETVRAEVLENKLVLQIDCEKTPDVILLNGKEITPPR